MAVIALTERLAILIEASGIGAISEFKKLGSTITTEMSAADKATKGLRAEGGLLSTALNKMGLQSIDTGAALKIGLAGAATAAAIEAGKLGENYLQAADRVRTFSEATGASAADSSHLVNAMRALGVDTETTTGVFLRFTRNIGQTPQALQAFGVEIARTKQGTTDVVGTLGNVADALQKIPDPARRAQLETAAFGIRGVAPLLPLLAQGKQGIEALGRSGPMFSDKALQQAQQFQISLNELKQRAQGLGDTIGGAVIGSAEQLVTWLDNLTGGHGKAAAAAKEQAAAEQDLATKLDKAEQGAISAVMARDAAQRSAADATHAVGEAQQRQADAQDNLNTLLRKGAVDAKAVADAQYSLTKADQAQTDAVNALAKARQAASAEDLGKAGLGVNEANLGVTDAALAVRSARAGLASARASGDPLQIAQANEQLRHALLGQQQAAYSLTDAQKALNDTQNQGKESTDAVTAAERQLEDAQHSRQAALEALHTAEVGNVNFSKEVKKAREDVANATYALNQAQQNTIVSGEQLALATKAADDALKSAAASSASFLSGLQGIVDVFPALKPVLDEVTAGLGIRPGAFAGASAGGTLSGGGGGKGGENLYNQVLDVLLGPKTNDTVSTIPPGLSLMNNQTGKHETLVNADLLRNRNAGGGDTHVTIYTGADPNAVVEAIQRYERRNGKGWRN